MAQTFAQRQGSISHVSSLKAKARRLGLRDGASLVALAVRRGCRHYLPWVQSVCATAPEIPEQDFSNEELVVALLLGSWPHEPIMIRAAAHLVGDPSLRVDVLSRLAVRERCVAALLYIAEAGAETEPDNPFWKDLLGSLPAVRPPLPRAGFMPHPSRFRSETGIVNPSRPDQPRVVWLRSRKST